MKIFGTDFDGVIINIEPQKAIAFGELFEKEWGLDKNEVEEYWMATGGGARRVKFDFFYHKRFGKNLNDEDYLAIESKFSNLLKTQYYPKVQLLPGALELLKFVKENLDFRFVSSGVPMEEINYLIKMLNLSEYFDLVLGTNRLFKSKVDHFQKITNEKHPDLIIFAGDAAQDMKVAKQFRAKTIGILTNCSKEELEKAGADTTCVSPLEAIPSIRSWL